MNPSEPCGVTDCPAVAVSDEGFCSVHVGAKRAVHVMAGQKCGACKRDIEPGTWITRDSTVSEMRHAVCPAPREYRGRKRDRWKPLLDALEGRAD